MTVGATTGHGREVATAPDEVTTAQKDGAEQLMSAVASVVPPSTGTGWPQDPSRQVTTEPSDRASTQSFAVGHATE